MAKKYYIYHVYNKKIGVTTSIDSRVRIQQGYKDHEFEILRSYDSPAEAAAMELKLQELYGYAQDEIPYNELKHHKKKMHTNTTQMTTTFYVPLSKLKGRLFDQINRDQEYGDIKFNMTSDVIEWINRNAITSQYGPTKCYIYNNAFKAFLEHPLNVPNNGYPLTEKEAFEPVGVNYIPAVNIRKWAKERGIYDSGDAKTQYVKLMEEAGELAKAIINNNFAEKRDAVGDMGVVLVNLSELLGFTFEDAMLAAYNEIKDRKGKMINNSFIKEETLIKEQL